MTRKNFEVIADIIKNSKLFNEDKAKLAKSFAEMFENLYSNFNKDKFYDRINLKREKYEQLN